MRIVNVAELIVWLVYVPHRLSYAIRSNRERFDFAHPTSTIAIDPTKEIEPSRFRREMDVARCTHINRFLADASSLSIGRAHERHHPTPPPLSLSRDSWVETWTYVPHHRLNMPIEITRFDLAIHWFIHLFIYQERFSRRWLLLFFKSRECHAHGIVCPRNEWSTEAVFFWLMFVSFSILCVYGARTTRRD